jgi:hypothetical protein
MPFGTSFGSNVPARSRGTSIGSSPSSVISVLGVVPLRWLPWPSGLSSPFA